MMKVKIGVVGGMANNVRLMDCLTQIGNNKPTDLDGMLKSVGVSFYLQLKDNYSISPSITGTVMDLPPLVV